MINRLINLVLLLVVVAAGWSVWQLLDQPIQTLRIKSDLSAGERAEVEALLTSVPLGGILSFDIDSLRQTLKQTGWARETFIRRQWPHVLEITLQREQPIARWGQSEFITASSQIVSLPDAYPELPRISAAISDPTQTLRVFRLVDQMVTASGLKIAELVQNPHGEWQVSFARGFSVKLGIDRLNDRLQRFLQVYNGNLRNETRAIAYVDVRYASGAAVKFALPADDTVLVASRPEEQGNEI
ncbi:MAG: cell division protein FtsQ/DivIB [Pseudomonadales bacterium]